VSPSTERIKTRKREYCAQKLWGIILLIPDSKKEKFSKRKGEEKRNCSTTSKKILAEKTVNVARLKKS